MGVMKLGDNLLALLACGLCHGDANANLDPKVLCSPLDSGVKVTTGEAFASAVEGLGKFAEGGAAMGGLALGCCNGCAMLSGDAGVDVTSFSTRGRLRPVMAIEVNSNSASQA